MENTESQSTESDDQEFSEFLSPISSEEFFEEVFEKKHFLFKRSLGFNDQFLSIAEFTKLLNEQKFSRHEVSIAKNGMRRKQVQEVHKPSKVVFPPSLSQRNKEFLADFRNGYTLVFEAFERHSRNIEKVVNTLTNVFQCTTHAHTFFTPENAQGYKMHYDTDDAFILQIYGYKRWQIYQGPEYLPSGPNRYDPSLHKPGELLLDLVLEPGDMLYIPRGVMHSPMCLDDSSLHVALGIHTITWEDLLTEALGKAVGRKLSLRDSVPFYKNDFSENVAAYKEEFAGLLESVCSESDFIEAAKYFNRFLPK